MARSTFILGFGSIILGQFTTLTSAQVATDVASIMDTTTITSCADSVTDCPARKTATSASSDVTSQISISSPPSSTLSNSPFLKSSWVASSTSTAVGDPLTVTVTQNVAGACKASSSSEVSSSTSTNDVWHHSASTSGNSSVSTIPILFTKPHTVASTTHWGGASSTLAWTSVPSALTSNTGWGTGVKPSTKHTWETGIASSTKHTWETGVASSTKHTWETSVTSAIVPSHASNIPISIPLSTYSHSKTETKTRDSTTWTTTTGWITVSTCDGITSKTHATGHITGSSTGTGYRPGSGIGPYANSMHTGDGPTSMHSSAMQNPIHASFMTGTATVASATHHSQSAFTLVVSTNTPLGVGVRATSMTGAQQTSVSVASHHERISCVLLGVVYLMHFFQL
ncbi:hypothetical protein NHQ30_001048 [Ciborinia camelliae]|nr:hypothetical protein NHQ30_001048 [Ciborinia camelliae]